MNSPNDNHDPAADSTIIAIILGSSSTSQALHSIKKREDQKCE